MAEIPRLAASAAAAGERPAILRHHRHQRHGSNQVSAIKRFASVTQNAKSLSPCVTSDAFASPARPVVPIAQFLAIATRMADVGVLFFDRVGPRGKTSVDPSLHGDKDNSLPPPLILWRGTEGETTP
jgi:hypothetical protein